MVLRKKQTVITSYMTQELKATRGSFTTDIVPCEYKKGDKSGLVYYTLPSILVEGDAEKTKANLLRRIDFLTPEITASLLDRVLNGMGQKITGANSVAEKYTVQLPPDETGKATTEIKWRIKDGTLDVAGLIEDFQELSVTTERIGELKEQLIAQSVALTKVAWINTDGSPRTEAMIECQNISKEVMRLQAAIANKKRKRVDQADEEGDEGAPEEKAA